MNADVDGGTVNVVVGGIDVAGVDKGGAVVVKGCGTDGVVVCGTEEFILDVGAGTVDGCGVRTDVVVVGIGTEELMLEFGIGTVGCVGRAFTMSVSEDGLGVKDGNGGRSPRPGPRTGPPLRPGPGP